MNKLISAVALFASISLMAGAQNPEKLRRADCFFGIHFDLHASEDITDAGKTLTVEMVDTFLTKVKPDFIQVDCKGHPGISSYPTKVGNHVKGFAKDPLKIWREATEKNNVGLFMHYSGVWDGKVAVTHPDWAVVKSSGERSKQKMSFFSPYLDRILIPQLKELSGDYHVDGAWIDGDCWAVEPDYGEQAIKAWKERTGFANVPKKKEDKHYREYLEFTRSLFRQYMGKYVDAIHAFDPKFQITSNWAYSSLMPEKVENNVDFLSGDVTPQNGVLHSAFEARCIAPQGKPWDLMAWGFSWNGGEMPMSNKSVIQLEQEASEIMAMGGGVQFYFQQNRDLSLKPWLAGPLSELGSFCRKRQAYCHKAKAVPQVAMLFPTKSYIQTYDAPFVHPAEKLQATLYTLLDNQLPVEILMEHHLKGKSEQYPLIVVPECTSIEPEMLGELRSYVNKGGNLLVIGPETAQIFAKELGIETMTITTNTAEKTIFLSAAHRLGGICSSLAGIKFGPGAKIVSNFYDVCDYRDESKFVASSVRQVGKGKIAAVYFNAGSSYAQYKTPVIRDFIAEIIGVLLPEMKVEVSGSHLVHVALNQLNGRTYINMVNVGGENTNPTATGYDQVPALTNLSVSIQGKPSKVILHPEEKELGISFENGKSTVIVPRLEIYSILEVFE
jgi:hypothetical protein